MSIDAVQFATQLALMGVGATGSWAVWVTMSLHKTKQDLNAAFHKIRELENAGYCSEDCNCTRHEVDD